ncbi:MAG: sulfate transporter CysZ [Gammaproteobacteria bacterium]|nr:sulfate transporter CysZ [Gammaproteobacteria bacterium]MDH5776639.1 sulfate transporter CysZ [Gammaproteobacteria bacterium]
MISNPVNGATYFIKGLSLIQRKGVKRFVVIPLFINVLIFTVLFWSLSGYVSDFINGMNASLPDWLAWLSYLIWLLFAFSAGIVLFFGFTIIANLVGAPFNGYLAGAVEKSLTGKNPVDQSGRTVMQEVSYAMSGEFRKILYFLMWGIPLLIMSFIPAVNLIAPLLWVFFSAWMMAIEYGDYPLGNHGMNFVDIRNKLGEKKMLSLGFGGAVMLGTMIPVFNFLVMPVAVAGATAMRIEQFKLDEIN